jgi:MFS family permease
MRVKRIIIPFILVLIGEGIFILPFLITRVFRPTFLKVFEINNFQLGSAFSVYGIIAMLSYFVGGPIADKFTPKKIIFTSLFLTGFGGFLLVKVPSVNTLIALYAFWGLTTILLFWAAFIKVIRMNWADSEQGKGFGIVDSGRGIVGALLASMAIFIFQYYLPQNVESASVEDLSKGIRAVIIFFSCFTIFASLMVLWLLPNETQELKSIKIKESILNLKELLKKRSIWLNGIIVLCSYVGYKCTDDFSLYGSVVLGYDDLEAAKLGTLTFWIRPVAALLAGFLGDRFMHTKTIFIAFIFLLIGSLFLSFGITLLDISFILIFTFTISSFAIYGLRGLYFSILKDHQFETFKIGTAVGVISFIGYTPDIFMGPLMGYLLDNNPGKLGHQYLFILLSAFCLLGMLSVFLFQKNTKKS